MVTRTSSMAFTHQPVTFSQDVLKVTFQVVFWLITVPVLLVFQAKIT